MRVLVTGSSGHIGGTIADHLSTQGWEVVGLSRTRGHGDQKFQQVLADIGDPFAMEQVASSVAPCSAIVHAAATLEKDPAALAVTLTNCLGTHHVLNLAQRWGTTNFVYLSSVPIIGVPRQLPVTEEHPVDPPTAYHASKLYGEKLTEMARRTGLRAAILRLTAPVGPRMNPDRILAVFVRRALADEPLALAGRGSRRQNYVDVRDVTDAVERCLVQRAEGLFNIAGHESISNLELARTCVRILGSTAPVQFADQPDPEEGVTWEVSIARAANVLGYVPRWSIEDSIWSVRDDLSAILASPKARRATA